MKSYTSNETSLYIIKPEGMPFRSTIREIITCNGLKVRCVRTIRLGEHHLRELYPHLSPDLWRATVQFMQCGECEVGVVEGESAVKRLIAIAGHSTDPNECGPKTVRGRCGMRIPDRVGTAVYYRNAIHRAKNKEEATRALALFSDLLSFV